MVHGSRDRFPPGSRGRRCYRGGLEITSSLVRKAAKCGGVPDRWALLGIAVFVVGLALDLAATFGRPQVRPRPDTSALTVAAYLLATAVMAVGIFLHSRESSEARASAPRSYTAFVVMSWIYLVLTIVLSDAAHGAVEDQGSYFLLERASRRQITMAQYYDFGAAQLRIGAAYLMAAASVMMTSPRHTPRR